MFKKWVFPTRLPQRGVLFGVLIVTALLFFEMFHYSTTDFALRDLLGEMRFLGIHWSTILAIAFCGIDFAGIARIFTPEVGGDEPVEVWYLFGAWLLAATMNAMLTWWGVGVALVNHVPAGSQVLSYQTIVKVIPIFVAVLVWLVRVLIIGTLSVAGDRLFSTAPATARVPRPLRTTARPTPRTATRRAGVGRPAAASSPAAEPQYEPLYAEGRGAHTAARF